MKKAYCAFLFLLLFSIVSYSQTGTIKIAKPIPPAAKKDTVVPKGRMLLHEIQAGGNYTFKGIHKYGYEAGILWSHGIYFGIKYSHEIEYYRLSAYNKETALPEIAFDKSINNFDYIKVPFGIKHQLVFGSMKKRALLCYTSIGLTPKYLIKTKNEYQILNESNLNRFNLSGSISIGFPFLKHYSMQLFYSKDFFENLKDKNIYNQSGAVVGKQKSKTDLLSLSISYWIYAGNK